MAPYTRKRALCREPSFKTAAKSKEMVGPGRLELPTSRLSGVPSNHLSYGPPGSETPQISVTRTETILGLAIASHPQPQPQMGRAGWRRVGKRNEDGGIPHR